MAQQTAPTGAWSAATAAARARPAPGVALITTLPTEVLELICQPLSLRKRLMFTESCRALLVGLAGSEALWGDIKIGPRQLRVHTKHNHIAQALAWLARRRAGLRRLEFDVGMRVDSPGNVAQAILHALTGGGDCGGEGGSSTSMLQQLTLANVVAGSKGEGDAAWQLLGCLTSLTHLELSGCELRQLPPELAALRALRELCLLAPDLGSYSQAAWGPLAHLPVTSLTRLQLKACGLGALPEALGALTGLQVLDISINSSLGKAEVSEWEPLVKLQALVELDIRSCSLPRLPEQLSTLPRLCALRAGNTGYSSHAVPEAGFAVLSLLTGLTRLDLASGHLSQLPAELSALTLLQDLDLQENELSAVDEAVWVPLQQLTALTCLNVRCCRLPRLPRQVSACGASLQDLNLALNSGMGGSEAASWEPLGRLTALTSLNLQMCDLQQLPREMAALGALRQLDLSSNGPLAKVKNFEAHWAPLAHLTALTCLDLSYCKLRRLPRQLSALVQLRDLNLFHNGTWLGRGGDEAMAPLQHLTALTRLFAAECGLPRELERNAIPFPIPMASDPRGRSLPVVRGGGVQAILQHAKNVRRAMEAAAAAAKPAGEDGPAGSAGPAAGSSPDDAALAWARRDAPSQGLDPLFSALMPSTQEEAPAAAQHAQQPASQPEPAEPQPPAAAMPLAPALAPMKPPALQPGGLMLPNPLLAAYMGAQQALPVMPALLPGGWPAGLPAVQFLQQAHPPPAAQAGAPVQAPPQGLAFLPNLQWLLYQQQMFAPQPPPQQGPC